MTDRELLELAAKAAGMDGWEWDEEMQCMGRWKQDEILGPVWQGWNPLDEDGNALRLAVKLEMDIWAGWGHIEVIHHDIDFQIVEMGNDRLAATRRAIVRAAAEIQLQKERND